MAITDIALNDITDPVELAHLRSMEQFHGLSEDLLFKLARRVTIFKIPSRWTAIKLILANQVPVPVASTLKSSR
jgi:hypothetical protein